MNGIPRCDVFGYGFQFYWSCDCGKQGIHTTQGRASAARDRHRRMHERAIAAPPSGHEEAGE